MRPSGMLGSSIPVSDNFKEGAVGLRCVRRLGTEHHRRQRALRSSVSYGAMALTAALMMPNAWADVTSGTTVAISTLSGSSTTLSGGTLQLDAAKTYSRDFTFSSSTTSTLDLLGNASTFSGKLTGSGNIIIADTKGSGVLTLSNSNNDYTGTTTINSGATLALLDSDTSSDTNTTSGTIEHSQQLIDNGTFDISGTVNGATIIALSGSGNIVLGSKTLTLNDYDSTNSKTYTTNTTFSGVISGKGGLVLASGEITLTGVNTLTGSVTVSSDTLHLSGNGSISSASTVYVYGTLDFANASSASIKSLAGSGTVTLGANNLVLTAAGNSFTGIISGTGGVILNAGTQYLTGSNTFTGGMTINGGTMEIGSSTVSYNVANSGIFAFYSTSTIEMDGVISGTGEVQSLSTGVTTITAAQTYTGATTITLGTIKLTGSGSIANSSLVTVNGALDISETSGTTIKALAGSGAVRLGTETLTITGSGGDFSGAVSGTGGIILTGGSQTFSGANTYSGTTQVNGGTLVLAAGSSLRSTVIDNAAVNLSSGSTATGSATVGSLSGAGTVSLGANTLVISNANDTFAGVISGTGGVWISSGTETFSGANTYTGATTVSGGSLVLTSTGSISSSSALAISGTFDATAAAGSALTFASLSGSGTVSVGAHILTLNNASGSFSGVIQGTAGLVISGGTEVLSGTNTYTGGTMIGSGAVLQLGTGAATGSILGDVVDNGTLAFNRNGSYTFSGVISGTGAVSQIGTGTTILTGANTYTGGTTISSGVLQIGDGTTTGSITGNVVNNGTLAFDPASSTSFSGVISGTGKLSVLSGTTTFTAASTYTGATTIASGATLALSGSGAIAKSSSVTANGIFNVSATTLPVIASLAGSGTVALGSQTLTFSNGSTTFSGAITGTGGLIMSGGTQTLSGTSSYTGATMVNSGTLNVTGSIASSSGVIVNSGGTLSGTGTVSALTVNSGGTVSAGTSSATGTLTVSGNATFASGSTYNVNVSSSAASKLIVSGTATLGGNITVTSTDGSYLLGQKVAVLNASSLSGSFTYATETFTGTNGALFKSTISQDSSNVYLTVDLSKLSPVLPTTATRNQTSVVSGIDAAIAAGSTLPTKIEALGNDSSTQLVSDTTQLSGEIGANLQNEARSLFTPFVESMFAHLNPGTAQQTGRSVDTWVSGIGGSSIVAGQSTDIGSHKFRSDVYGIVMGANWKPWANVTLGAALSAETSQFHITDNLGKGNAKAVQAGVYGYAQLSPHFYNAFAAGGSIAQLKTDRIVTVNGTDDLTAKLTAYSFGGRYEAGMNFDWISPYLAAEGQFVMLPSYSEGAASGTNAFALSYASRTGKTASVEAGIRNQVDVEVTPRWLLTPDWVLRLTDRLAYIHDFSDGASADANFLDVSTSSFAVKGADTGKDGVRASVGADFLFKDGFRITSHLDTTFSKRSQSFTGYAGLAYQW